MIGDLQVWAQIIFSKLDLTRQAPVTMGELGVQLNVTGKYQVEAIRTVGNSVAVSPDTGDIGSIGFVCLKNLGAALIDPADTPTVSNVGTAGSTAYSYKIVAIQADGGYQIASGAGSTSTGNATLNGTNYNALTWDSVDDAVSYDVYRSASSGTPSTTGKIGNATTNSFSDTGLAGDGSTAPTTTPYNFDIKYSVDGVNWTGWLRGGESQVFRPYNGSSPSGSLYMVALANSTQIAYLICEA